MKSDSVSRHPPSRRDLIMQAQILVASYATLAFILSTFSRAAQKLPEATKSHLARVAAGQGHLPLRGGCLQLSHTQEPAIAKAAPLIMSVS